MMKKLLCLSLLATGAMLYATADPLKPENWNKQFSTSGKALKIAHAEKENAVRFLASFPDSVKDRWLYPAIALSPEDRDADTLHFEIRAVPESGPDAAIRTLWSSFWTPKGNSSAASRFRHRRKSIPR